MGGEDLTDLLSRAGKNPQTWEQAKLESIGRRGVVADNPDQRQTLELICRLGAICVAGGANGLAEVYIEDAAEAVRAARDAGTLRKSVPYFMTTIREKTRKDGIDVNRRMSQATDIPV